MVRRGNIEGLGEGEVRSMRSFDGTRLTYYVMGNPNRPPMVIANGLGGSVSSWRHFVSHFAPLFRIYIWDYRGLFASDPAASGRDEDYSMVHHSEDLAALLAHERLRDPVLVGWSMGVQVVLEFFRHHPDRAKAFVALNGTYGTPFQTAFHSDFLETRFEKVFSFVQRHWERAIWLRPHLARTRLVNAFARALQAARIAHPSLDRDIFFDMTHGFIHNDLHLYSAIFMELGRHDAFDVLDTVGVPSLVVAGSRDTFIPPHVSREMSEQMPHCEYWEIPNATHFCPLEFPHVVNTCVRQYLHKVGALPTSSPSLRVRPQPVPLLSLQPLAQVA